MSDETASLAAAKVSAVAKAAASTAVDIEQMRPTAIAHRDVVTMGWLRLVGSLKCEVKIAFIIAQKEIM